MSTHKQENKKSLLIIFYRNPVAGKVKTRLAATVGNARALDIYHKLTEHTKSISQNISADAVVYYSDHPEEQDTWTNTRFKKKKQAGVDLGERMAAAFHEGFALGYRSICIIGTDCFELTTSLLEESFNMLQSYDAVIGPAKDGGYYLLGMNSFYPDLFKNKLWSTDSVSSRTLADFETLGLRYFQLPVLTDVDEEKDLPGELIIS